MKLCFQEVVLCLLTLIIKEAFCFFLKFIVDGEIASNLNLRVDVIYYYFKF